MKLHYGTRTETPAQRNRLVIQERAYTSWANLIRAKTLLVKYWDPKVGPINCFDNGKDEEGNYILYFCRTFTPEELKAAGFDPSRFYDDIPTMRSYR